MDPDKNKKTDGWPELAAGHDNGFIPTANAQGYMLDEPDALMEQFAQHAQQDTRPVVDIGAAYGVATRAALKAGATEVLAVDPAAEHIAYMEKHLKNERLRLLQASSPCELPYDPESVGAFLFSRVMHFLNPVQIEESLEMAKKYLAKDGKIFVITLSVYVAYFKEFIAEYEKRVSNGDEWPGMLDNLQRYLNTKDAKNNPEFIHLFTPKELRKIFENKGFIVESCLYATRKNYPSTIKLDGREDVILIARKP